jgi:hypothetical protein
MSYLLNDYYYKENIIPNFGFIDSPEMFNRFIKLISIDVDLFILPTRAEYKCDKGQWENKLEKLLEHKRVKNVLLLFDEEEMEGALEYHQKYNNVYLFLRPAEINKYNLENCLDAMKKSRNT